MDITYLSLNMPRDSSLSTCKVRHFLQLEAEIVSHPALFHYNLFVMQVKPSLDWSDFIMWRCAEKELQVYLNAEGPSKDFNEFRTKLAGLTS
jgi:hypothetical protein